MVDEKEEYSKFYGSSLAFRFLKILDCTKIELYKIVLNSKKAKLNDKIYYDHSRYVGGMRERTAKVMRDNYPVEMVERAVKGMLPKGRLGRAMYKKLFVYANEEHPHMAQKPEFLDIASMNIKNKKRK